MDIKKLIIIVLASLCVTCNVFAATLAAQGIILIGNPRGLTTAFERYMIQRGDFVVYHEPIITHKYSQLYPQSFKSPFAADFTIDMVLQKIYTDNAEGKFFVKEMARSLIDSKALFDLVNKRGVQLIFLIRKPEQSVLSHFKLRSANPWSDGADFNSTEQEVDYRHMQKLFLSLKDTAIKPPILIEADDLLDNPQLVLSKLCVALGIDFKERDLRWQAGESKLWPNDVTSWQKNVTNSTGFKRRDGLHSLQDIPAVHREKLRLLIAHNNKIYAQLVQYKLSLQ